MIKLSLIFVIFCMLYNEVINQMEVNPTYQNLGQHIATDITDLQNKYISQSQPNVSPYPYYGGVNPFPYYYSQYLNNPYPPNFFPGSYVQRYYPSLYQEFPNGFYVLPDTSSSISNTIPSPTNNVVTNYAENSNPQNSESIKRDTALPQTGEYDISNYTSLGQQKSYVSNVELKPLSTILTRYSGSNGKSYVKLVSSDSNGKDKITNAEYNGKVNFKINNGVVEPNNSDGNLQPETIDNSTEGTTNDDIDPNSIIQQIDQRSQDRVEDETSTEKPTDVNAWYT